MGFIYTKNRKANEQENEMFICHICLSSDDVFPTGSGKGPEGISGQAQRKGLMHLSTDVHRPCLPQDLISGISPSKV